MACSHQPNAPVELDPSYDALLKDADMSILRHKTWQVTTDTPRPHAIPPRELEVVSIDPLDDYLSSEELDTQEGVRHGRESQKSPAALFGSQHIGAVVLPFELQQSIARLISGTPMALRPSPLMLILTGRD